MRTVILMRVPFSFPSLLLLLLGWLVGTSSAFVIYQNHPENNAQLTTRIKAEATPIAESSFFDFQGHKVYTEVTPPLGVSSSSSSQQKENPAIVLIHGFGASAFAWRETTKALSKAGYSVYALDLLGLGSSDKPGRAEGIEYTIDLWAQLVNDYVQDTIPSAQKVVYVGNSLGSVVALSAATGDFVKDNVLSASVLEYRAEKVAGVCLFNCGVGMNSRNLLKDPNLTPLERALFTFLFDALDFLIFDNMAALNYLLKQVVTPELLRNVLTGLYQNAENPEERVDDGLVQSFLEPSQDPGAPEAFNQIYTNDPGPLPMDLYEDHYDDIFSTVPIQVIWGSEDTVTPIDGPVAKFFLNLSENDKARNVSFEAIKAGHVLFDEVPECNQLFVKWLDEKFCLEENVQST